MISLRLSGVIVLLLASVACAPTLVQQTSRYTSADSALVGRILAAEDRRDADAPALAAGLSHPDSTIRLLARRASARIADSAFVGRDSLPPLAPPPVWPEPAWRLRFRALTSVRSDCNALKQALGDPSWPVRLRATDLLSESCCQDAALVSTLVRWIDEVPRAPASHAPGEVSWHAAAHAVVALARLQPQAARRALPALATHPEWHLRLYATRAAGILADTVTLKELAGDVNPNVAAASIEQLSRVAGHAYDALYLAAVASDRVQVVRVSAEALVGSPDPRAPGIVREGLRRWVARGNASERDVRVALLKALGQPATADQPPPDTVTVSRSAIALALGAERTLTVEMAERHGGGHFVVKLRGDVAPIMAARILELASHGYYDGLTWHRVEHDFVIQGGSPGDDEYVGLDQYLRDELGTVPHLRGTVGMSTRGHDTGDAQWFINLRDNQRLDPAYSVFGEVIEGMDVVDGVMEGDAIKTVTSNK